MWVEVLCLIDRIWSTPSHLPTSIIECAVCACDLSVHISVPSIGIIMFMFEYV